MTWIAVGVSAAAALGGAAMSSQAAKKAASMQAAAADRASQLQAQQFQQTQANLAPYTQEGQVGLGQINAQLPQFNQPFGLQQFQESPAYQFNLQQGQQALNKQAAARQMYYAPQTLQDLSRFSQGLASNEYQNAFQNYQQDLGNRWSRLMGLTNLGQVSAAGVGNLGAASAAQQGGFITQGANAQAAGTIGQANAVQNALQQGMNMYQFNQLMQQNQTPTVTPTTDLSGSYIDPSSLAYGQTNTITPLGGMGF